MAAGPGAGSPAPAPGVFPAPATSSTAAVIPAPAVAKAAMALPEVFARDSIIAWYRGEFAAANAIIDALCHHLTQIDIDGSRRRAGDYEALFAAIHWRRMNWIPVLHMQKYFSIADVAIELRRVAAARRTVAAEEELQKKREAVVKQEEEVKKQEVGVSLKEVVEEEVGTVEEEVKGGEETVDGGGGAAEHRGAVGEEVDEDTEDSPGDSPDKRAKVLEVVVTGADGDGDTGSLHGGESCLANAGICSDHDDCAMRPDRIKTFKGFVAKEPVKGHMVNVVKGLKLYEDIFTDSEMFRLAEFINELRLAGRNGELHGDTFIFFNKQLKGNKREIIQLGVPIFQPTKEETSHIEPIPQALQAVIDHLIQWRLIPESRKPNSCIINFFDEEEYSQPYFKPPHLDNPISTLLLSETTMAFGRVLVSDHHGNYKGSLTLPLKEGSLLVMRGNSADVARHVVCPSSNLRACITFVKVRPSTNQVEPSSTPPPLTKAMTLWQPGGLPPQKVSTGGVIGYGAHDLVVPRWGITLQAPVVMFSPPRPIVMNPAARRIARGGTGVFLPWTVGSNKKYTKHLPPRIQRRRLPALSPAIEAQIERPSQIPCVAV